VFRDRRGRNLIPSAAATRSSEPACANRRIKLIGPPTPIYLSMLPLHLRSKKHNPLLFNRFHTLCQKTQLPGVQPPGLKDQNETTNSLMPLFYPFVAPIAFQAVADAACPSPIHVRFSVLSIAPNNWKRKPPITTPTSVTITNASKPLRASTIPSTTYTRTRSWPRIASPPVAPPFFPTSAAYSSARGLKSTPIRQPESPTPLNRCL
jgi:hypothetical protein